MVDWNRIAQTVMFYWQEFLTWFFSIPLYGQVLVIIGAAAAIVLTFIIVYYIIKGIVYLIYYIFKGLYLLFKAIFTGIYKLIEELYYLISGKPKPVKEEKQSELVEEEQVEIVPKTRSVELINPGAMYCNECGSEFTETMNQNLAIKGLAYCVHCGKGFKLNIVEIENY